MAKFKFVGKPFKNITPELKAAIDKGFEKLVTAMDKQLTQEIQSVQWDWPRQTKRKNGSTVSSPRDIVDTGDLMRSQRDFRIGELEHRWVWDVEYSSLVHNGAVLKNGGNYPARPWIKTAERVVKPDDFLSDIISRELDG